MYKKVLTQENTDETFDCPNTMEITRRGEKPIKSNYRNFLNSILSHIPFLIG
jgi:hypothetical protein